MEPLGKAGLAADTLLGWELQGPQLSETKRDTLAGMLRTNKQKNLRRLSDSCSLSPLICEMVIHSMTWI